LWELGLLTEYASGAVELRGTYFRWAALVQKI